MDETELIHEVNVAVEEAIRLYNENHPGADREEAKSLIIQIGEVVKEKNYTKALSLATKAQDVARGAPAATTRIDTGGVVVGPAATPSSTPLAQQVADINIPGITTPGFSTPPTPSWSPPADRAKEGSVPKKSHQSFAGVRDLPLVEIGIVILVIVLSLLVWFFLPL